tara:strand:- start:1915 stop:2418 length:504 start_codon:yes stop_codon:yes gene_type:complete
MTTTWADTAMVLSLPLPPLPTATTTLLTTPSPQSSTSSGGEEEEAEAEVEEEEEREDQDQQLLEELRRRRNRNRVSAKRCRDKKREIIFDMVTELESMRTEVTKLRKTVNETQVRALHHEAKASQLAHELSTATAALKHAKGREVAMRQAWWGLPGPEGVELHFGAV